MFDPREIKVDESREMAIEAVAITKSGNYLSPRRRQVDIGGAVARAIAGTVEYPPDAAISAPDAPATTTRVEVANESTIAAAARLSADGHRTAVLNLASAVSPGGNFLHGARAQEESLARSSALWACLDDRAFYEFHREQRDPLYSDYAIYSPAVPFFRGDDHRLLEEPLLLGVITSAAPNRKSGYGWTREKEKQLPTVFRSRIRRILQIGLLHGHDAIVLGAFGCGAFGNDPHLVADAFRQVIDELDGRYARIVFAILDTRKGRDVIAPFERALL